MFLFFVIRFIFVKLIDIIVDWDLLIIVFVLLMLVENVREYMIGLDFVVNSKVLLLGF